MDKKQSDMTISATFLYST